MKVIKIESEVCGVLGEIPTIFVAATKPSFINNGYACYSGQPDLHIPGFSDRLPDEGRPLRQGHVMIRYTCGGRFLTYTSNSKGKDIYSFS